MNVVFQNSYDVQLQLIIAYADETCPGEDNNQKFYARGWYTLDPGQSRQLFSTNSPLFYYYAEDTIGRGDKWTDQFGFLHIVRGRVINQCLSYVPPGSETIGLVGIATEDETYVVNLQTPNVFGTLPPIARD